MKGLLLKDLYMCRAYCRNYLFIALIFIAAGFISYGNMFFMFYPCMLAAMVPVSLLGYDERSRWCDYCRTMPYSKAQIVSAKYLIGLILQLAVLMICSLAMAVKLSVVESAAWGELGVFLMTLVCVSCLVSSISMPFMFKYGVEKGRIAYYVMVGVAAGGSVIAAKLFEERFSLQISPSGLLPLMCGLSVLIFALSWYLSIVSYKKREC